MTESLSIPSLSLRVRHLDQSGEFYVQKLGFSAVRRGPDTLDLAVDPQGPTLLTLVRAATRPAPRETAGLFHAALLLPSREGLASWLSFAAAQGIEFEGFSDHGVSEAIYLSDPDGIGLEIYADRPRREWPVQDGELAMVTRPLATRALLEKARPNRHPIAGSRWGHVHLRVTDLARSEAYYCSTLGMAVTQRSFPGARFLAADGYHHHVGLNTWGRPTLPASPDAAGLMNAVFARTAAKTEEKHTDPDGMALTIVPMMSAAGASEPVKAW